MAFWLILAVGSFLRAYDFGAVPSGIHFDEASIGIEALSILRYGTDRWGNPFPIYFPAWGSGLHALQIYLTVPFIKLFGVTSRSVRMLNLIVGIATLPLSYHVTRQLTNRATALIAMALVALLPWHMMMSRSGFETILLPFLMLCGLWTLSRATQEAVGPAWRVTALVPWALCPYAYMASALTVPPFLLMFLGVNRRVIAKHWRSWLAGLIVAAIIVMPMVLFLIKNYVTKLPFSFEHSLAFSLPMFPASRLYQAGFLQSRSLGKNVLLLAGMLQEQRPEQQSVFFAPLTPVLPFFSLLGVVLILTDASLRRRATILVLFFLSYITSLLLVHVTLFRLNAFMLALIIIASCALTRIYQSLSDSSAKRAYFGVTVAYFAAFVALFDIYYFTQYNTELYYRFKIGLHRAFDAATDNALPNEKIWFSGGYSAESLYIYPLFFEPSLLDVFRATAQRSVDPMGAYEVTSFGRFLFGEHWDPSWHEPHVIKVMPSADPPCDGGKILFLSLRWRVMRCAE